ncbi:zinc finger CCCH domain-containing protein 20-like [Prosopis cineraria]|uniref:zinc finger CCCH domain-containing protein 20-like n=1 Tax=Prosopis cineraria TaxID=364024 RepID=UPI00241036B3|nr:zinc finger CCCH domain-containing protein 20-like [Prosopis cineraria]
MIREQTPFLLPDLKVPPWLSDNSLVAPSLPTSFPVPINTDAGAVDSSVLLHHHPLLSNDSTLTELHSLAEDFGIPFDAFSTDQFRMFEFKIRKCPRGGRSHDWTRCPFAHPGEKARRRDPRKFQYSATPCPDFRLANCKKGDSCDFAHGVFECWLHPSRYRTQLCKDATNCRRRVCFFAHTPDQLRILTRGLGEASALSPIRRSLDPSSSSTSFISSPPSVPVTLSLPDTSPSSPGNSQYGGKTSNAMSEVVTSMRNVQLDSNGMVSGFCSPRGSILRPGFFSLQSTRTWARADKSGPGSAHLWANSAEDYAPVERVESGRDLRAKIYAKLSNENSYGRSDAPLPVPDFGWVSELVK